MTLLRCVGTISRERMATRPFPAGPDVPTPLAQMIGETAFRSASGRTPTPASSSPTGNGSRCRWRTAVAAGGGALPASGSLLEVSGDAALSNVRRRDGALQVRLWNPRTDTAVHATVGGNDVVLGPARIETIEVTT